MTDTLYNKEGKDYLQYEWVNFNDFDKIEIRPIEFMKYFKNKEAHLINNELK